ncbi:hypothetical protein Tco_0004614 [Tanacetum coccineum]
MGDENPIRTLGDYSKPSHEGYSNTIDLPREIIDLDHFYDTLYLTGRSLEVLRKFHWMILGGRFNQLSHVSS